MSATIIQTNLIFIAVSLAASSNGRYSHLHCQTLAAGTVTADTSIMRLKSAAVIALIGTLLLTILLGADLIRIGLAFARDVVPAMALVRSLIDFVAAITVTVFFYVFTRSQSR